MINKRLVNVIVAFRNAGFGDNLRQSAFAWKYAKVNNISLQVIWVRSRYLQELNISKRLNAFHHFFDVPDHIESVPIVRQKTISRFQYCRILWHRLKWVTGELLYNTLRFPKKNSIEEKGVDFLTKFTKSTDKEIIVSCFVHRKYDSYDDLLPFYESIRLRPDLNQKVKTFSTQHFKNKKRIGIHVRSFDNKTENSDLLPKLKTSIQTLTKDITEDYIIFLCTDSPTIQSAILNYNLLNLVVYNSLLENDRVGGAELHDVITITGAENSIIEMFLLAECDILIRNTTSMFNFYASFFVKEVVDITG